MTVHNFRLVLMLVSMLAVAGCSTVHTTYAIHSDAVRELIQLEGEKIRTARQNARNFTNSGAANFIKAHKDALTALTSSFQGQQQEAQKHALVFSTGQNLATKTGTGAYATAYLVGELYMTKQVGLEKTVLDQFDADFKALEQVTKQIESSWATLENLHAQVEAYAQKSVFASVDPQFVAAVVGEIPNGSQEIDTVIASSKKVNDLLRNVGLEREQTLTRDLVELLGRVKKQ